MAHHVIQYPNNDLLEILYFFHNFVNVQNTELIDSVGISACTNVKHLRIGKAFLESLFPRLLYNSINRYFIVAHLCHSYL